MRQKLILNFEKAKKNKLEQSKAKQTTSAIKPTQSRKYKNLS